MATYERATRVSAPFERVWNFHRRISGLERLTPEWVGLRVEWVRGPEGESNPDALEAGASARISVRPLGVGPRVAWTTHVVASERREGAAWFRDVMADGPFPEWTHTHLFYRDGEATVVRDRVEFALPPGALGRRLSPLGVLGLEPAFRYRHRRTRDLLEGPDPADTRTHPRES